MANEFECPQPGIYFGMPESEYHAARALSCSGIKQLSVSPLNYWHNNLSLDREPPEESYPQRFGKAVHCRLLEPDSFRDRFAVELSKDDHSAALVTVDDLKVFLSANGLPTSAKKKQEL